VIGYSLGRINDIRTGISFLVSLYHLRCDYWCLYLFYDRSYRKEGVIEEMIRYRCWDTTYGKMFYPEQSLTLRGLIFTISMEGKCYLNGELAENQDRLIFMLSTGLYDSNIKEMYQGDIVYVAKDNAELTGEIFFSDAAFLVRELGKGKEFHLSTFFNRIWAAETEVEVIGNIYENPDLLEKT